MGKRHVLTLPKPMWSH